MNDGAKVSRRDGHSDFLRLKTFFRGERESGAEKGGREKKIFGRKMGRKSFLGEWMTKNVAGEQHIHFPIIERFYGINGLVLIRLRKKKKKTRRG